MSYFNSKHFMFIIWGTTIISLKIYPSIFIKDGGRDSWIAVILSSIILFAYFNLILAACKKNNCYSLYKIYICSTGNIIGTILICFFIGNIFLALIESNALSASVMHTNLLLETPIWYMLIFFVPAGIYSVKKGLYSVFCVSIISLTLIFISGINLMFLTFPQKHFSSLLPILKDGFTSGLFICFLKSLGLYGCIMISFPYLQYIKDKTHIYKHSIIALIVIIQMIIFGVISVLATFVPERSSDLFYPKIIQTQLVSVMRFIEGGELYVMLQAIGGWFVKYILAFFAIKLLLKEMNFNKKYTIYILGVLTYFLSWMSSKNIMILFKLLNYYSYICLINFVIIPTLVFTIYFFKKKPENAENLKNLS